MQAGAEKNGYRVLSQSRQKRQVSQRQLGVLKLISSATDSGVVRSRRKKMNGLLKFATDAHGGLGRWNQLNSLTADLSVTGAIWHVKGKPDFFEEHPDRIVAAP